jgi:hypothetical protein
VNPADVWGELETSRATAGVVRRRIHADAACDLYLGIRRPDGERLVMLGLPDPVPPLRDLPTGRGATLRRTVLTDTGQSVIELALTLDSYSDLFDQLVVDVAGAAAAAPTESEAVARFVSRLARWQAFLRSPREGLDAEQRRGLYGELLVLSEVLLPVVGRSAALRAWTGPEGADQDFNFRSRALEVKTTAGRQHQRLGISSERQLDSSHLESLFLAHLSLEERDGVGRTLPELVGQVRQQIADDAELRQLFDDKLAAAGYFDGHADHYGIGHSERDRHYFRVEEGCPRIVEHDLVLGVGEVRYSIAVASLAPWLTDEIEVTSSLAEVSDG